VAQLVADRPDEGIGVLRLRLVWPFPDHALAEFPNATAFIVPEQNLGQIASEVERHTDRPVIPAPKLGGELHTPAELARVLEGVRR
jgi:2-oxoglutarate ferredoxin oxidoreductase subunit alpha